MSTFIYDFNTQKTVTNPLEGITHFYATPYDMASIWQSLNLGDKLIDEECELFIQAGTGLPVIILPLSLLNLGRCSITMRDDLSGGKIVGRRTIYFTTTLKDDTICITGVK